jgi:hypothetical protein
MASISSTLPDVQEPGFQSVRLLLKQEHRRPAELSIALPRAGQQWGSHSVKGILPTIIATTMTWFQDSPGEDKSR